MTCLSVHGTNILYRLVPLTANLDFPIDSVGGRWMKVCWYSLAGDVAAICRSPAVGPEVVLILSRVFLIILGLWIHVGCASFGRTLRRAVMVYEQEGATLWCACAFTSTKKVKDMQVQSIISTFPLYIYIYMGTLWHRCLQIFFLRVHTGQHAGTKPFTNLRDKIMLK